MGRPSKLLARSLTSGNELSQRTMFFAVVAVVEAGVELNSQLLRGGGRFFRYAPYFQSPFSLCSWFPVFRSEGIGIDLREQDGIVSKPCPDTFFAMFDFSCGVERTEGMAWRALEAGATGGADSAEKSPGTTIPDSARRGVRKMGQSAQWRSCTVWRVRVPLVWRRRQSLEQKN